MSNGHHAGVETSRVPTDPEPRTAHSLRRLKFGAMIITVFVASCGSQSTSADDLQREVKTAAGDSLGCVYRPPNTTKLVIVTTNRAASERVIANLPSAKRNEVIVLTGDRTDSPAFRNAVLQDVRGSQPLLDERIAISIESTKPLATRAPTTIGQPLCGITQVSVSGFSPTPAAYARWLKSIRHRLPTLVRVRDFTING